MSTCSFNEENRWKRKYSQIKLRKSGCGCMCVFFALCNYMYACHVTYFLGIIIENGLNKIKETRSKKNGKFYEIHFWEEVGIFGLIITYQTQRKPQKLMVSNIMYSFNSQGRNKECNSPIIFFARIVSWEQILSFGN